MNNKIYPELGQLLAGYLHQFWKEVHNWGELTPSYIDVIYLYKYESSEAEIKTAIKELEDLLAQNLDEEALHQLINYKLHCGLHIPAFGMTYEEWLIFVLNILKNPEWPEILISRKGGSSPILH